MAYELLDHGVHLVYLDRIHDVALRLVLILLGGTLETLRDLGYAVVQYVGEAQQYRQRHVVQLQVVHQRAEVNLGTSLLGAYHNIALAVDREVVLTPAIYVV